MEMVRRRCDFDRFSQMYAGFIQISGVDESYPVSIVVLRRKQVNRSLLEPPVAHRDVESCPLGHIALGSACSGDEQFPGIAQLAGVEQLHGCFKGAALL